MPFSSFTVDGDYVEYLMNISVIVTTYNRAEKLGEVLASLIGQETNANFTFEIVVIDNASTDGTGRILEEMMRLSRVPLRVVLEPNQGVAYARNKGIKEAYGDWLAFFDDDQIAQPDWLCELVAVARKMNASCVGGCIRLCLPVQGESVKLSTICRAILGETTPGEIPRKYSEKSLPGTGNVLLKRDVFAKVGQFDTTFSRGGEDADLFRRIKRKGIDMWYAPKAVAHHITPPYRLETGYLVWCSLRDGVNYAHMDKKENGVGKLCIACFGRFGQALFINVPRLLIACVRNDRIEATGQKCLLARAYGYLRQTLFILAPKILPHKSFFDRLDFRSERNNYSE